LNERAKDLEGKGVAVLAVHAAKADPKVLEEAVKKMDVSIPMGTLKTDKERPTSQWSIRAMPWMVLTDKSHVVRAAGFGLNELDPKIKEAGGR